MKKYISKYTTLIYIILIAVVTLIGLYLRISCCKHGYPYVLHPDEHTIVDNAIDILERHSYFPDVYHRPDHFEIKINALIFTIYSYISFGRPAYEVFKDNYVDFYICARYFSVFFGTLLIPLTALFTKRLLRGFGKGVTAASNMVSASLVAFSPFMIEHSSYATPDIVLTFFVVLTALFLLEYLYKNKMKWIVFAAVCIGIGISIKYTALILTVPLFVCVIISEVRKKTYARLVTCCFIGFIVVFLTVFLIAPNIFINYSETIETLKYEARDVHLGADDLGFFGNSFFYLKLLIKEYGFESLVFIMSFLVCLIGKKKADWAVILTGLFYMICMSTLALHWPRWEAPAFPFYVIGISLGFAYLFQCFDIDMTAKIPLDKTICKGLCTGLLFIMIFACLAGGICFSKSMCLPTTINLSSVYVGSNGINAENSIYEGYTPLKKTYHKPVVGAFDYNYGTVSLKDNYIDKEYIVISDRFKEDYYAEPERYQEQCAIYDYIDTNYTKIYELDGSRGNYDHSMFKSALMSLVKSFAYLRCYESIECSGRIITIYRIQ